MHMAELQKESSTEELTNVANKLGSAIVDTMEYQTYHAAEQCFQSDPQAQELLKKHEETRQSLQLMWQLKSSTEEEMQKLRELKKLIEANQTLKEYFNAQEKLVSMLRELNEFISERLNLDFSGLTKPQRGCCG